MDLFSSMQMNSCFKESVGANKLLLLSPLGTSSAYQFCSQRTFTSVRKKIQSERPKTGNGDRKGRCLEKSPSIHNERVLVAIESTALLYVVFVFEASFDQWLCLVFSDSVLSLVGVQTIDNNESKRNRRIVYVYLP
jgi:hypothetical protein